MSLVAIVGRPDVGKSTSFNRLVGTRLATCKSNERIARLAIIFQLVKPLFIVANLYLFYPYFRHIYKTIFYDDGGHLFTVAPLFLNTRLSLFNGIYGLWSIAAMIFFLMWFHRAYRNLWMRLNSPLSHSPGWTVWGWFVPILNLFRPYKMMREMFIMTGKLAGKDAPGGKRYRTGWIGWWWALCVIPIAIVTFVLLDAFLYPSAEGIVDILFNITLKICGLGDRGDADVYIFASMVYAIIFSLLQFVLTLMTIKLIRDYSRVEATIGDLPEKEPPTVTGGPEGPPYIYIHDDSGFDPARPPLM